MPRKKTEESDSSPPWERFKRDENGLLVSVEHIFKEDGSVDWRAMIPEEYIFINEGFFAKNETPVPTSIEGLSDEALIISLAGLKELLKIRGMLSRETKVVKADKDHVVCTCKLTFMPNYETCGREVVYEEVANASAFNVDPHFGMFLETIAANRAFARAIRNALRIDIVGDAELPDSKYVSSSIEGTGIEPWRVLMAECKKRKFVERKEPKTGNVAVDENGEPIKDWINTFDAFKQLVIKVDATANEWSEWKDIPTEKCIIYLSSLKSRGEQK